MTIRPGTIADAPQIAKIHVEVWQSHYRGQVPDSYLDYLSVENRTKKWTEFFSDKESTSVMFVAEEEENLLGWCVVGKSRDEDASESVGELGAIYVSEEAQGKGVGKTLMQKSLEFLKEQGYTSATLWVLKTNTETIGFYEKFGWKADGEEKKVPKNDFFFDEIRYTIDL